MQNYGGYYQQYQQGQNQMYPNPGGQNSNMNQSNMRNMFGGPQNYGMPQMQQGPPQQYGYQQQQQQQMPQQNFVFHFDMNNAPTNMSPYATANPPQYGSSPYGGPQMQQNGTQKKEDKNDELFNAFDPFNPKPRTQSKPKPPQNTAPQQPPAPNPPQIQMMEDTAPKKQDLDAFRTAFASLAGPAQQPQQQPPQQFGMQTGQIYGGNMQAPPTPQIEGFNFTGGIQNTQNTQQTQPTQIEGFNFAGGIQNTQQTQPTQMENFNFGTQQQQNNTFANQTSSQPINPSFYNQQQQAANNSASKNTHEDIFASFNPIASSQPKTSNQQQQSTDFSGFSSNNQAQNQFGNSDAFSFGKQQTESNGGMPSFNQQQTGSNGGMQSFNQQQTGSGSGFTPFSQQQTGSNGGMPSFNQQQTGSNGGISSFNQQQAGSGGGFTPFSQQQTGSNGGMPSFNQQQAGSNGGISSFNQQQAGSGSGFTPFSQQQTGSNGGIPSFNQQQTGSGGGFTPFSQQQAATADPMQSFNQPQTGSSGINPQFNQPQAGSTGNLPHNTIDNIFGSPSFSQQQQTQKPNEQPQASSTNPFLFNVSNTDSNLFAKSNEKETSNNSSLAPPQTNNLQNQPQEIQNNGFSPFGSAQNQQTPAATTGTSSFGDSFRQAIGDSSPSPSQQPTTNETPKQAEGETSDFHNIFSQGHNFFEQQEQQFKSAEQQQQQTAPEGFTFTSQNIGDSGAPNFSNFTFNTPGQSEQNTNSQFGGPSFANFGGSETNTTPQINKPAQEQPAAAPFTPFGVSDLQPMPNSTFVISGSGDSVSSQPTAISASQVDAEKIPYFVEQEKKMEFENRIKNDTMSVFDPFNPNPQSNQQQQQQQPQQPQQSQQVQNAHKETVEQLNLSASINASVDTIRNLFGGHSDENVNDNKEEEKQQENEQKAPENQQQNVQLNDANQNPFLGGFSAGLGSENNDTQNKTSNIQLNVGMGEEDKDKNDNNNFENNPFAVGNGEFQGNFGKSPEANSFGFGGFGFNNSFGKGNVFQHVFETGNMEVPATFSDFFPHHNSEPVAPPIQVNQPKEENKEEDKEKEQPKSELPKSEPPFATGFDFLEFNQPKQSENQNKKENEKQEEEPNPFIFGKQQIDFNNPFGSPEPQQKQEEQKVQQKQEEPNEPKQQNQKEIDYDNPFINQSNLTLFGQIPNPAQTAQKNEPFNPFGNQSLETASQTSPSMSFTSTADIFSSQVEIQKKDEPETKQKENTKDKGKDIFDEIPNDISEIDKSLPEKPPPFIMPTIGDSSTNPFTSVLSSTSPTSNPFATNNNNNVNPFMANSSAPESNPFTSQSATENTKDETKTTNKEDKKEENNKSTGLDDLIGFDFGFSSSKPEINNEKEKTSNTDNPFLSNFNNDKNESTETKQTEKVEDKKETKEEKTEQDTSGFTFSSATSNNTNDANPFSKGFNPFGGDFSTAFASSTATNDNQSGGFTFTPTFDKEEEKESKEEVTTTKEEENQPKDEEEQKTTQEEINNDEKSPEKNEGQENDKNMNIVDTLDDDLFDFNSVESFQPVQHKGKSNDLFGDIHTFPVSNSTSDFLELKQKKENKNNNVGQSVLMMSDGGVGSKQAASPLIEKSQTINTGFISILTPYGNTTDDNQFSVSSDGEDPEVLKIMSDDNSMSKILKKYIKPPENDFYGPFEKDPHPIRIFPKFENTEAAKVLAEFVSNQFGITASFASTSKKQKEEIDMNSIFNAPAASEPNDDDDFLLII